jgi:hypothetical protein
MFDVVVPGLVTKTERSPKCDRLRAAHVPSGSGLAAGISWCPDGRAVFESADDTDFTD